MLQKAMDGITEFHHKHNFVVGTTLDKEQKVASKFAKPVLLMVGWILIVLSKAIVKVSTKWQNKGDCRLYRAHLMIEEIGETIMAAARCDEVGYADGLADTTYVVLGSAVTDDIPLSEIFNEVQKANMQKEPRNKFADPRLRNKGKNWKKPDIKGVLDAYNRRKR